MSGFNELTRLDSLTGNPDHVMWVGIERYEHPEMFLFMNQHNNKSLNATALGYREVKELKVLVDEYIRKYEEVNEVKPFRDVCMECDVIIREGSGEYFGSVEDWTPFTVYTTCEACRNRKAK